MLASMPRRAGFNVFMLLVEIGRQSFAWLPDSLELGVVDTNVFHHMVYW